MYINHNKRWTTAEQKAKYRSLRYLLLSTKFCFLLLETEILETVIYLSAYI